MKLLDIGKRFPSNSASAVAGCGPVEAAITATTPPTKVVQPISDDEAVWQIQTGDVQSYEVLAARYHRTLCRVAGKLLRSKADAEDVVQRAHLRALKHINQCAAGSSYFSWMYSIVLNETRTHIRRRRRLVNIGDTFTGWISSSVRSPEQQAVDRNVEELLERAVESLPSTYGPVFRLREIEELTTAETGQRLGLSQGCVRTRLFRARDILRKRLRPALRGSKSEAAVWAKVDELLRRPVQVADNKPPLKRRELSTTADTTVSLSVCQNPCIRYENVLQIPSG